MPSPFNLLDEPRDVLALFGGIVLTLTLLLMAVFFTDVRELIIGAFLPIVALIYNHFFQKSSTTQE